MESPQPKTDPLLGLQREQGQPVRKITPTRFPRTASNRHPKTIRSLPHEKGVLLRRDPGVHRLFEPGSVVRGTNRRPRL